MKRFKHIGERLKELQKEDLPGIREQLAAQVESDKGRRLTAEEYELCDKTAREIAELPKYGG